MVQKFKFAPLNEYGWISLILGIIACTLYSINLAWPIGIDAADQALVSILIVLLLLGAIAFNVTHFKFEAGKIKNPLKFAFSIIFIGFIIIALGVMVLNMASMTMSTDYSSHARARLGIFEGFRMLGQHVTQQDLNDINNWGTGIASMIKALFLCIPFLIVTWGALSALTANSISEMDGALFSFVASMLFTIEVWMFQLANIILGS